MPGSASGFKLKGLFVTIESETDYEVGQDNVNIMGLDIHNPVFFISGGIIVLFVFFAATFQAPMTDFFGWLRPAVTDVDAPQPAHAVEDAVAVAVGQCHKCLHG